MKNKTWKKEEEKEALAFESQSFLAENIDLQHHLTSM